MKKNFNLGECAKKKKKGGKKGEKGEKGAKGAVAKTKTSQHACHSEFFFLKGKHFFTVNKRKFSDMDAVVKHVDKLIKKHKEGKSLAGKLTANLRGKCIKIKENGSRKLSSGSDESWRVG